MEISLDITDGVGLLRFDDGKKNAFSIDGIRELTAAFPLAEARCLLLLSLLNEALLCAEAPGLLLCDPDLCDPWLLLLLQHVLQQHGGG